MEALAALGRRHVAAGVGRASNLVIRAGRGAAWKRSTAGASSALTAGIGVLNTGHCHPRVVAAAAAQCAQLTHGQVNITFHEPMLRLIERLAEGVPQPLDTFFFATTGSEAVEGAVKMARHATRKPNVIVMQGGFHGRTVGAMALTTSKTIYRAGFGPLMPGVFVAPFPYRTQLRWPDAPAAALTDEAMSGYYCLRQLELLLAQQARRAGRPRS